MKLGFPKKKKKNTISKATTSAAMTYDMHVYLIFDAYTYFFKYILPPAHWNMGMRFQRGKHTILQVLNAPIRDQTLQAHAMGHLGAIVVSWGASDLRVGSYKHLDTLRLPQGFTMVKIDHTHSKRGVTTTKTVPSACMRLRGAGLAMQGLVQHYRWGLSHEI